MASILRFALLALVVTVIAACGSEDRPAESPPAPAPIPAPDAVPAPPSLPETGEPAPTAPEPANPTSAIADETGTPAGTASVTGFHGFGPARFGDDEESVRIAWGRPMSFDRVASADAPCAYLAPDPKPSDGLDIAFMFESGKFVRYDVKGDQYQAPGSGMIGNTMDALKALYEGRYTEQPHKYIEGGRNLIVSGPDGSDSRLIFEIGADGTVSSWRVGVPPQVDYVEGCG